MLAHRLRHWSNIQTTLGKRVEFAGFFRGPPASHHRRPTLNQHWSIVVGLLFHCITNAVYFGPALRWSCTSLLLVESADFPEWLSAGVILFLVEWMAWSTISSWRAGEEGILSCYLVSIPIPHCKLYTITKAQGNMANQIIMLSQGNSERLFSLLNHKVKMNTLLVDIQQYQWRTWILNTPSRWVINNKIGEAHLNNNRSVSNH